MYAFIRMNNSMCHGHTLRILLCVVWCEWHPLEDSKTKRRERERERERGGCFGFGFYVGERSEGYLMPFYSFKPSG